MAWLLASITTASLATSPFGFTPRIVLAQADLEGAAPSASAAPAAAGSSSAAGSSTAATAGTAAPGADAGATAPPGPGMGTTLVMMGLIFLFFWLFLIRPQNKQAKEHQKLVESLKKGDDVVTQSGIFGKIAGFDEPSGAIQLEIAKGTVIRVLKAQVGRRQPTAAETAATAAAETEAKSKTVSLRK